MSFRTCIERRDHYLFFNLSILITILLYFSHMFIGIVYAALTSNACVVHNCKSCFDLLLGLTYNLTKYPIVGTFFKIQIVFFLLFLIDWCFPSPLKHKLVHSNCLAHLTLRVIKTQLFRNKAIIVLIIILEFLLVIGDSTWLPELLIHFDWLKFQNSLFDKLHAE